MLRQKSKMQDQKQKYVCGKQLHKYMTAQRMTEDEIAELANVSVQTIRNYLSSHATKPWPVSDKPFKKVCDVLKVSPEDLTLQAVDLESPMRMAEISQLAGKLSLKDCLRDCLDWTSHSSPKEVIRFHTIAIDLSCGWENIVAAFNVSRATLTRFEILMLTDDPAQLPADAPPQVVCWSHSAAGQLVLLRKALEDYRAPKRLQVEVRQYASVPTIHGLVIPDQDGDSRYYLTECRYDGGELLTYHWGDGEYHAFSSNGCTAVQAKMADRFENTFSGLWRSRPVLLEYDSATLPNDI